MLAPGLWPLGEVEKQFVRQSREGYGSARCFVGAQLAVEPARIRAKLGRALAYAQSKHPMLSCVLVKHPAHGVVLQRSDMAIRASDFPGEAWMDVFQRLAKVPLALNKLPVESRACSRAWAARRSRLSSARV